MYNMLMCKESRDPAISVSSSCLRKEGLCALTLWLERHNIFISLTKTFLFFLLSFPSITMDFFPILFWFLFNKCFNNVIYLFFSPILEDSSEGLLLKQGSVGLSESSL